MDNLGLFGSMLGHIGDGNFHETILYDGELEREKVEKCVHDMVRRALETEGTCTVWTPLLSTNVVMVSRGKVMLIISKGKHGIGLRKKDFLLEEIGVGPLEVMRGIKRSLDPNWLMNPRKIFDA